MLLHRLAAAGPVTINESGGIVTTGASILAGNGAGGVVNVSLDAGTLQYVGGLLKVIGGVGGTTVNNYISGAGMYSAYLNLATDPTYACLGNGTDETSKVLAAVATGRHIFIPTGFYVTISSTIVLNQYQNIVGEGSCGFIWSATTGYAITVSATASGNFLAMFTITQKSGVTPTSGGALYLGDPAFVNYVSAVVGYKLIFYSTYEGIRYQYHNNSHFMRECIAYTNPGGGYVVDCKIPYGIGYLDRCQAFTSSTGGLIVHQCDTSVVINFFSGAHHGPSVWLRGDTGEIGSMQFFGGTFENNYSGNPIRVGDGGNAVLWPSFFGPEIVTATALTGIYIGPYAVDCTIKVATVNCLATTPPPSMTDYGLRTTIDGIKGSILLTNGVPNQSANPCIGGLALYGTGTKVRDCNTLNLTVNSAASQLDIQGNSFYGAISIPSSVYANSIIKNNLGIPDFLTSISAAPWFVGQSAIVGGVAYLATGTSSVADWKQITN